MVLSSQTTMRRTRHTFQTDVAACWGNLAGAAATGAEGCNSPPLPNPSVMLGDTDTGHEATRATLPFWKDEGGGWERSNLSPTGGRQHDREVMSSNGVMLGDDRHAKGAVVLRGATWADRRIAQASQGNQNGCCGVLDLRVLDASDQNLDDSSGPSRDVDNVCQGKGAVRNIWLPKGRVLPADCTASGTWLLIGLHLRETGQKIWITWEVPCYTSTSFRACFFLGLRQGMGAAVIRFKQVKQRLRCKPCVLVFGLGRKLLSVEGCGFGATGNLCEDLR